MAVAGVPLFPVTVVGSWPRPKYLLDALRQRQAGRLSFQEFNARADQAVLECLKYQQDAGVDIVSDGEQRRDNFYSFVTEKLDGVKLMSLAELMNHVEDKVSFDQILRSQDAPAFAIHNPTVVGKVRRRQPLAADELLFLRQHTGKPIKVALPGPYLLTRSMWVKGVSDSAYPTMDSLAAELVQVLRQELLELRDAGVAFVQFDEPVLTDVMFRPQVKERTFMCASMAAASGDSRTEMVRAVQLLNAVVRGVEGVQTGVHVCRGNWSRKEEALLQGSYEPLLMYLLTMQVNQLVLEFATPRAGELAAFQRYPRIRELGLGVVNPRSDEVERPQAIVARVEEALRYFQPGQVYLNPDCGFGTFAERPMNTAEVAFHKLQSIAQAARTLRAKYADGGGKAG
ncbi:MAG: cobalamin-independent methionine synthase II family protein [Chloroflexi bacterium]|nr:cobalamin-independent methionine synthase II family protein [Chloroflexota bacterium]